MAEKKFIIEVRSKGFARATRDFKNLNKDGDRFRNTTDRMRRSTVGLERSFGSLRNRLLVNSFAFGLLAKSAQLFFRSSIQFEDVKTRLVGLTGSVEGAESAFAKFSKVAATTPFQLQDVVNAGAQLSAFGAEALETIKPITDLAAFMGTTATEAANAFGRAYAGGAGAADILREKGILNIIKDFKGIDNITQLTLPQFRQAMLDAFVEPTVGIAGSTDRLSKTFTGAFSNMLDSVSRLTAELAESFLPTLTSATTKATSFFDNLIEGVKSFKNVPGEFKVFGEELDSFTRKIQNTDDIKFLNEELEKISSNMESASEPIQATNTQITALLPSVKQSNDQFKIFSDRTQQGFIDLEAFDKELVITEGVFGNLKTALDETEQSQAATSVGVEKLQQQYDLIINRLKELFHAQTTQVTKAQEVINSEEVRQSRIAAGIELDKMRQGQMAIENQLLDDQVARMENAAMASAGMVTENEKVSITAQQAAQGILLMASSLKSLTDAGATSEQKFKSLISTLGQLLMLMPDPKAKTGGAILQAFSMFIGHTGGLIKNNGIQRFATGGMVQGQDNVPIMAQAGEFIMRREAVQNIGVNNLADMNRSGSAGSNVTVNISGGLIDDGYINNQLIPAINEATSTGNKLNA